MAALLNSGMKEERGGEGETGSEKCGNAILSRSQLNARSLTSLIKSQASGVPSRNKVRYEINAMGSVGLEPTRLRG
jgi:hypothetical protein